jgi:hypothetical protein
LKNIVKFEFEKKGKGFVHKMGWENFFAKNNVFGDLKGMQRRRTNMFLMCPKRFRLIGVEKYS